MVYGIRLSFLCEKHLHNPSLYVPPIWSTFVSFPVETDLGGYISGLSLHNRITC